MDYFSNWLEGLKDGEYPHLDEIEVFCHTVSYYLGHWLDGVEAGIIDPEAGVAS